MASNQHLPNSARDERSLADKLRAAPEVLAGVWEDHPATRVADPLFDDPAMLEHARSIASGGRRPAGRAPEAAPQPKEEKPRRTLADYSPEELATLSDAVTAEEIRRGQFEHLDESNVVEGDVDDADVVLSAYYEDEEVEA